jgi:predicted flap endonuclease-1-like 5' DNA nuclease
MTELQWQAVFLLVAAFFLGAVIACSLKRKFYYRKSASAIATPVADQPAATEPKIEVTPREQADSGSERFGSALAGGASVAASAPAPASASEPAPAEPAAPPAPKEDRKLVFPPMVQKVESSEPELEPAQAPSVPEPMPAPQPAASVPVLDPAAEPAPPPAPAPTLVAEAEPTPVQDGAPPARDMSHLRSVRSEALRGPEASRPSGAADDLKRIRGIGVLIEKKLTSLGVTSYEQVANWTGADIERVSQILDFKGRIERENWIEQARILATGGQTEFSRRNDRSDA